MINLVVPWASIAAISRDNIINASINGVLRHVIVRREKIAVEGSVFPLIRPFTAVAN